MSSLSSVSGIGSQHQESAKSPNADQVSPRSALLSPSVCRTSRLAHSKELHRGRGEERQGEKEQGKEDSPGQGAPASCHPGDGPDSASLLSSGEETKKNTRGTLVMMDFSATVNFA